MKQTSLATLFIFSILLTQSTIALAQNTTDLEVWASVKSIRFGEELVLVMKDGKTIKGKLRAISDTGLTLSQKGKISDLDSNDIRRVYMMKGRPRAKSSLLGAAIGSGVGVGVGLGLYLPNRNDIIGWVVPAFGVIGAGVGAVIGAITGGRKRVLIYQVK
jgi:hypothetical protein